MNLQEFSDLIAKFAKVSSASQGDLMFGAGIDISSIAYTEFILELEELYDLDIDVNDLDPATTTVGQLHQNIFGT